MAESKTLKTRVQHPVYTAAALKSKNPVLLKGEVVYESDTRKHKVGDGVTAWNALPYAGGSTSETISAANVQQDTTHRFVTDAEKSTWNGKASTAVATQSANGLMTAADKKKLDGISSEAIGMLGEDYEEVLDFNPMGVNVDFFKVKFVPGFVIIHAQVEFQTRAARFITPAYAIQSRAVIETYVSFVESVNMSYTVKIMMGGNTETTAFMFQVPDEVLNTPVVFHCAIPVLSVTRF